MAQETLKLTITADTAEAAANLQNFIKTSKGLKTEMQNFGNVSNQATFALSNLSRVAQDAPYGFMGIANNLNPLLESFQRLKVDAGSSSGALKAMAQNLMGPAGIGLALGVASSLLVTFGDKLFQSSAAQKAAAEKTKENTDRIKEQKDALDQVYSSTAQEVTQVSSLIAVLQNENETRNRKLKALEALKKINPEIFNALTLEKGVVIGLNTAYDTYIANLSSVIALKIKQKELEQVTEQILKEQGVTLTQEAKEIIRIGKIFKDSLDARKTDVELRNQGLKETIKLRNEENHLNGLLDKRKKIFQDIVELSKNVKVPNEYDAPKALKPDKILSSKEIGDLIRQRNKSFDLLNPLQESPEDTYAASQKRLEEARNKYETFFLGIKEKNVSNKFKAEQKDLQELTRQYEQFAQTLAGTVTNALFGMYDAIQQGENPLQVIADMFKQIAFNIAAMVIQALIFQAIIKAFPALEGAFTALGVIGKATGGMQSAGAISGGVNANTSFNAGGMRSGSNMNASSYAVLRGQDLLVAINRTQKSSFLKGQNISLL
jgi:hypothetical protein